jgi:drug/metabolite transporter (DMT)-like permease
MVLGSAAAFGTLPILIKYAYATGLSPLQALAIRFLLAALGLHALALLHGERVPRLGGVRVGQFLLLGGVGYAAQAATFFAALCCLSASLVELLAYIYPSLVTAGAWLLFRRRVGFRRALALAVSFGGLALLIGGGARLAIGLPLLLALAAPVVYSCYILAGEQLMRSAPVLSASALVHTGTAVSMLALLLASRQPVLPHNPASWPVLVLLAIVPSMIAISLFLAGIHRVGGPQASLLSTVEPVVTWRWRPGCSATASPSPRLWGLRP